MRWWYSGSGIQKRHTTGNSLLPGKPIVSTSVWFAGAAMFLLLVVSSLMMLTTLTTVDAFIVGGCSVSRRISSRMAQGSSQFRHEQQRDTVTLTNCL
jgi:hypothetical protein